MPVIIYLNINQIKKMKKILFGLLAFTTIAFTACGSKNNNAGTVNKSVVPETAAAAKQVVDTVPANTPSTAVSIKDIVGSYLQMKNAFTKDNTSEAATAGKTLQAAFINFDTKTLSAQQQKIFTDIADDAKEHAEHIGANGGNIAHQREHFDMLSKDMADLIQTFGNGGQTLYKDFCPMYNKGKGAYWISETKEIKNPYLGKAMPTCGTVKEEIKQ